jgi:hypothetical protein
MSEAQPGNSKPFDPLEPFREMRDAYLDAMAKTMVEAVNTDAYAKATGAMLDNTLTISNPFKEAMEKSMLQVLQQLSLPSRQDILSLSERFTNIEMRLDDMDASLSGFETTLQKTLLPILQQLLLVNARLDGVEVKLDRLPKEPRASKTTPASAKAATKSAAPVAAKAAAKRAPVKQAPPKKRIARKGTR